MNLNPFAHFNRACFIHLWWPRFTEWSRSVIVPNPFLLHTVKILPVCDRIPKHFQVKKEMTFPLYLIFFLYDFLRLNVGKFDSLFNYSNVNLVSFSFWRECEIGEGCILTTTLLLNCRYLKLVLWADFHVQYSFFKFYMVPGKCLLWNNLNRVFNFYPPSVCRGRGFTFVVVSADLIFFQFEIGYYWVTRMRIYFSCNRIQSDIIHKLFFILLQ